MYKRVNKLLGTNYKNNKDINWDHLSSFYDLSEDFIREFQNYVNWGYISLNQVISEKFIEEFKDKLSWPLISRNQILSEDFIRKYKGLVNWYLISEYQVLSEDFIKEFENFVNWENISRHQILSPKFMKDFKFLLSWINISNFQPYVDCKELNDYNQQDFSKRNNLGKLYQKTKDRGWFIGYILKDRRGRFILSHAPISLDTTNQIKARVYWKDLIKVDQVRSYEFIRLVKKI